MRRVPLLAIVFISILWFGGVLKAEEKIAVGVVEEVVLLPWGVKLPARIDTGAATTSLDARDLVFKDDSVEFRLPDKYGGLKIALPVAAWRTVRSAGSRQRRPVVNMDICMGPKVLHARVNLNDRSRMKYPLILGRNILKEGFFVDCLCANILKPSCAEIENK
jgi:hypothetical protein